MWGLESGSVWRFETLPTKHRVWRGAYFRLGAACASAEPAMRCVRLLDRPSRSAAEASFATAREVCFVLFFFLVIFVTSLGLFFLS